MKNITLCFIALCFPLFSYAQFSKGDTTFDLDLEVNRDIGFLSANYGRFVSDHLLIGNGLNFGYFNNGLPSFSYFNIGIAPYVRYYFNPQQQNNYFYTQATYAYTRFLGNLDDRFSGFVFQLGFDHFVAPGVAFTAKGRLAITGSNGDYYKNLDFQINLTPYLMAVNKVKADPKLFFRKGSLLIGGTKFNILRSLDRISWSLKFNPRVGYFFGNRMVGGAEIDFQTSNGIFNQTNSFSGTQFVFSPFARFYLNRPKRFSSFLAVEIPYQVRIDSFQGQRSTTTIDILSQVGLASSYFITSNIALEGILSAHNIFDTQVIQLRFGVNLQYLIH